MEESKVFLAMKNAYPKLTAAERAVADYFLQNREQGDFSSKTVAAKLYVSEASLSRFAQKCGFKGYRELSTSTNVPLRTAVLIPPSAR